MFTLKITTATAAFDKEGTELARILREVAENVLARVPDHIDETVEGIIRDVNGNTVGKWKLQ